MEQAHSGQRVEQVAIPRPVEVGAASDRDEAQVGEITMITDRGVEHSRNEDAAAAGIVADATGGPALAVAVCDGVSSSHDGQRAAAAASKAGVAAMLAALAAAKDGDSAIHAGLTDAARAAAALGVAGDPDIAPSCTYTAAVVTTTSDGTEITVGNVGDSRVYWFPRSAAQARQVTVDDSLAQELISAGVPSDAPAVERGAHTLIRWLGADNDAQPWADSSIGTFTADEPGWLMLCSDGLWNYLPETTDLLPFLTGSDAVAITRALTDYALAAGGVDNITVALVPISPAANSIGPQGN